MTNFSVSRTLAGEGLICLALSGELDMEGVPLLEAALAQAVADSPVTVALDLSALEFLDSTGLRAIIEAHENLESRGAGLVLTRGRRNVQATFTLTGVDAHLTFIERVEDLRR